MVPQVKRYFAMPRYAKGSTKLTDEIRAKVMELLRAGNTRLCSALSSGISKESFYNYMKRDESFASDVEKSEAVAEALHVTVIAKAAQLGDWRASESWLKRRRRADWGDYVTVDKLDVTQMTDEQLEDMRTKGKVKLEMVG